MTNMYDEEDELNLNPAAEHDEWEQAIKDDKTLMSVNERYRVRQVDHTFPSVQVWCGTCNAPVEHDPTYNLAVLLEAAKAHELEVHS